MLKLLWFPYFTCTNFACFSSVKFKSETYCFIVLKNHGLQMPSYWHSDALLLHHLFRTPDVQKIKNWYANKQVRLLKNNWIAPIYLLCQCFLLSVFTIKELTMCHFIIFMWETTLLSSLSKNEKKECQVILIILSYMAT